MRPVTYRWPRFSLTFEPSSGTVTTYYDQWRYSRVHVDEDDRTLAEQLGISPEEHKLAHELAHHLVALHCGLDTSPIVWRSAHFFEHPEQESHDEEAVVKAFVFYALSTEAYEKAKEEERIDPRRFAALHERGIDIDAMADELRHLVDAARLEQTSGATVELV